VVFEGKTGAGKNKHVVFVIGDDAYQSEVGMRGATPEDAFKELSTGAR
jgi:hypothetical protein